MHNLDPTLNLACSDGVHGEFPHRNFRPTTLTPPKRPPKASVFANSPAGGPVGIDSFAFIYLSIFCITIMELLDLSDEFLLELGRHMPISELKGLMLSCKRLYNIYVTLVWKNISLCPPRMLPEHALEEHALEHPGTSLPQDIISPAVNPNITNENEIDKFLVTLINKVPSARALSCMETLEFGPRYFYCRPDSLRAMRLLSRARVPNLKQIQVNLGCDRYKISKGAKKTLRSETVNLMTQAMDIIHEMLHRCKAELAIQACYPLSFESTFSSPMVCSSLRELGLTFNDSVQTHSELAEALARCVNLKILNIKTYNGQIDGRLPVLHYYQTPLRALKKLEQLGIASGSILNQFHPIHLPPNLKILSLTITPYYGPNPQLWSRLLNRDFARLESFYFAHSFAEEEFAAMPVDAVKIITLEKLSLARTPVSLGMYRRILMCNPKLRMIEIKPDIEYIKVTLENCPNLQRLSGGKNVALPSADVLRDNLTPEQLQKYASVIKR